MAIYLYAITDCPQSTLPEMPGLEGAAICSLACRDIAAVFSLLPTPSQSPPAQAGLGADSAGSPRGRAGEAPPTEANLWRHEAVVEALMADRSVLPVRFGTVLAHEAALRVMLTTHYANFVASLDRVRGRVELGLRVLWEIADSEWLMADSSQRPSAISHQPSAMSGRSYLLARLEEHRQAQARRQWAEALVARLHTPLGRLAVENTRQVLLTSRLLLTAAYLVDRERVAAFRREVEALSAAYPALRFLCTGPWPAYNFVTASVPEMTTDHGPLTAEATAAAAPANVGEDENVNP
ncbi:MAG: GvpL/GvpF family gas vesicle protein [Chloroflexi bacterium]|nr:GvpL/GvpF family gas vesicle protein [Chloroflexota bacterium]